MKTVFSFFEKNYSPATAVAYIAGVRCFHRYINRQKGELSDDPSLFSGYAEWLIKNKSHATIRLRLRALSLYGAYLQGRGVLSINHGDIKAPSREKPKRRRHAIKLKSWQQWMEGRDLRAVALLALCSAGLRTGEAAALKPEDIASDFSFVRVGEKVYGLNGLEKYLETYFIANNEGMRKANHVFFTRAGKPMSRGCAWRIVKEATAGKANPRHLRASYEHFGRVAGHQSVSEEGIVQ